MSYSSSTTAEHLLTLKPKAPAIVEETKISAKTASGRITKGPAKTAGAVQKKKAAAAPKAKKTASAAATPKKAKSTPKATPKKTDTPAAAAAAAS